MKLRADQVCLTIPNFRGREFWTAPAERSGDGAFARAPAAKIFCRFRPLKKRRGASLPAAVQDAADLRKLIEESQIVVGRYQFVFWRMPLGETILDIHPAHD